MPTNDEAISQWQKIAAKELGDPDLEKLNSTTAENIVLKPLYTEKDSQPVSFARSLPGVAPYTRGPKATMYCIKPWTIRQYAGFSTAEASNAFYRKALAAGQKGLSVAFDLATHRGYDSDHPRVSGDVGKAGVAINSVEDMKILFKDIPLGEVSVSMTMNGAVLPILAAFVVAGQEQGVEQAHLSGTIQNDILKEYMVRNTYIYPPTPSLRIVADIIEYTAEHMPKFNSVSISGYHMQEAGADSALELAYTLGDGIEYVKAAIGRGLKVDDFAPRLSFFFGIGMNFFMEIAKLRAARTLWHELMQQFNPKNPKSSQLRTHCQTSGFSLTEQDPFNNIIRTTIEAMAAALGGTQSLHTNSFDEATSLPSDFSARLARNTQLILQEETDLCRVVDPFGGSYFIEKLTHDLIEKSQQILQEVEANGGMIKAIQAGLPKLRIEEAAAKKQARIDSGEEVIVGVNKYRPESEKAFEILEVDNSKVLTEQVRKLTELKKNRNTKAVEKALQDLKACASSNGNLLAQSIECMRLRATVGEVSLKLEEVFGRYSAKINAVSNVYIKAFRRNSNDMFDEAVKKIHEFAQAEGRRPRILIVKLGQDGHDRGAKVIATGFSDMGFDVDIGPLFQTPEEAVKQAIENDVHVIGVSSQAGAHKTLIPQMHAVLKKQKADDILIVVGGIIPHQDYDFLLNNGAKCIFGPATPLPTSALQVIELLQAERQARKQKKKS